MKLATKLVLMASGVAVLATIITVSFAAWRNYVTVHGVQQELLISAQSDLRHSVEGVYNTVECIDRTSAQGLLASNPVLREAIYRTTLGKTGYVWVLGGNGADKGHYIISKGGKRDGEDIWNTKDASGGYCIREMVNKAIVLKPGEVFFYNYKWLNPGDKEPRKKLAAVVYYEPCDWVIGAGCYEDEMLSGVEKAKVIGRTTLWGLTIAGFFAALLAALIFRQLALGITKRIYTITLIGNALASGDVEAASKLLSEKAA